MPPKKKITELKNPFSEEFMVAWNYWKGFKKEQFRFSYKPMGEQHAIDDLFEISNGDEQVAKLIIKQSIVKGWRGLFELKSVKNGQSGTTGQQPDLRSAVQDELNKRFAQRKSAGS